MTLAKRISIIIAAVNILMILAITVGTNLTVDHFKAMIQSSSQNHPYLVELIFSIPKFILVLISLVAV